MITKVTNQQIKQIIEMNNLKESEIIICDPKDIIVKGKQKNEGETYELYTYGKQNTQSV